MRHQEDLRRRRHCRNRARVDQAPIDRLYLVVYKRVEALRDDIVLTRRLGGWIFGRKIDWILVENAVFAGKCRKCRFDGFRWKMQI